MATLPPSRRERTSSTRCGPVSFTFLIVALYATFFLLGRAVGPLSTSCACPEERRTLLVKAGLGAEEVRGEVEVVVRHVSAAKRSLASLGVPHTHVEVGAAHGHAAAVVPRRRERAHRLAHGVPRDRRR